MISTDKQFLKNVAKYVISAVISILLIAYIIYHVVNSFGTAVETEPAQMVSVRETISGDGFIFRSEKIVSSTSTGGGVNYAYENGELVPSGVPIADIYSGNNTDEIKQNMSEIDSKISILKDSSRTDSALLSDSGSIDESITSLYYSMLRKMNSNEIDYVFRRSDDMLILLNKRQLVLKTASDFSSQIAKLNSDRMSLTSSLSNISETVKSDCSGYFFTEADGYENIFSASQVDTLSVKSFDELRDKKPEEGIISSSNVIGKIMTDYTWYLAVKFASNQTAGFVEGNRYTLVFPYSSDIEIDMSLYRIITDADSNDVVLVFSTGSVPENFNFLRMQSVDIVKQTYKGLRVPVSAVRIVDDKQGVYILDGNVVTFKEINSLVEIAGNLIVAEQDKLNDKDYESKLGFYDQIITKGKNLYEHKVVG